MSAGVQKRASDKYLISIGKMDQPIKKTAAEKKAAAAEKKAANPKPIKRHPQPPPTMSNMEWHLKSDAAKKREAAKYLRENSQPRVRRSRSRSPRK